MIVSLKTKAKFILKKSTRTDEDLQVLIMNDVKLPSCNFVQILSSETPPRGGWRYKTFCQKLHFLFSLQSRMVVMFFSMMTWKISRLLLCPIITLHGQWSGHVYIPSADVSMWIRCFHDTVGVYLCMDTSCEYCLISYMWNEFYKCELWTLI